MKPSEREAGYIARMEFDKKKKLEAVAKLEKGGLDKLFSVFKK